MLAVFWQRYLTSYTQGLLSNFAVSVKLVGSGYVAIALPCGQTQCDQAEKADRATDPLGE